MSTDSDPGVESDDVPSFTSANRYDVDGVTTTIRTPTNPDEIDVEADIMVEAETEVLVVDKAVLDQYIDEDLRKIVHNEFYPAIEETRPTGTVHERLRDRPSGGWMYFEGHPGYGTEAANALLMLIDAVIEAYYEGFTTRDAWPPNLEFDQIPKPGASFVHFS